MLEGARKKNFKSLLRRYSVDKSGRPDSVNEDPAGEDCSTPELRTQAWTNRVQKFVNAKDICTNVEKWGVKVPEMVDGKQVWV